MSSSHDILVIGAGVLGLCSAVELGARGRSVTVVDPGGPSASSVAAGMIAPAAEAWADLRAFGVDHAALFTQARDLWPAFAARRGIELHRDGVEWRSADPDRVAEAWTHWGFPVTRSPWPFTSADWRIVPDQALAAMERCPGVVKAKGRVASLTDDGQEGWRALLSDGSEMKARTVVIATGVGGLDGPRVMLDALSRITPIRGQLGFAPHALVGPVLRAGAGYVAPAQGGLVVGATMEQGRVDLTPDAVVGEAMMRDCLAIVRDLPIEAVTWRVGVRGASPDGLPMAGRIADGLFVALAPRRNGWLLGPMVAEIVADAVQGQPMGPNAEAFDPTRYT